MSSEHREYSEIHHSEATLYSCRSPRSRLTSSRTRQLRYLCSEAFLDQSTSREFRSKSFSLCLRAVKAAFFLDIYALLKESAYMAYLLRQEKYHSSNGDLSFSG